MANGHGGRRPGAGRPAGSPDREPRIKLLTTEERALVIAYREHHADLAASGRAKAIRALIGIVETSKDDHARVKAAGILLGAQTGGQVVNVGVQVNATEQDQQSMTELVLARLDGLHAAGLAEQAAAERADPMADVLGDVAPTTGWPLLPPRAIAPAAEPPSTGPTIVDAEPADDARGAESRSDDARAGSPSDGLDRAQATQRATAAAAWTGNGFGPDGLDIGSSVGALGDLGATPVDTSAIPTSVDTVAEVADALVTGSERSARTWRAPSGAIVTEVGKATGTGLPPARRRAGRTG